VRWLTLAFNVVLSAALIVFFVLATMKELRAPKAARRNPIADDRWAP
jgi:hypothetical protein